MVSTATEDAPAGTAGKGKNDSDKAGTVKQAAARKSPAGKKASGKKTATRNRQAAGSGTEKSRNKAAGASKQAAGKSRRKAQPASRNKARPEKVAHQTGGQTADAEATAADAVTGNAANKAGDDSRSISWMSAQAVSALKAVKASQARKAESLLARVEKPVPGKPGITELPEQTSEDLLEEIPEPEAAAAAAPGPATSQETTISIPTNQKEAIVMQEKPGEVETTAAEAAGNTTDNAATEVPATAVNAGPEPETTASPETVVAARAQPRGLPARPIVMTVFLAMLAYSGYHYWMDKRDSHVAPPPVADSFSQRVQDAAWDDIPQQEAIAVVGAPSGEQSAPAATAPEEAAAAPLPSDTATAGGFASTTAMEAPGSAAAGTSGVDVMQPAAIAAPPPAAQAEMETPEPAEATDSDVPESAKVTDYEAPEPAAITATEPSQPPQAETAAAPPARPVQQQPRYGAPGYGYYPQQRNWQQPYYQPARPPQYPAR
ncbi:MAG: hypothetical protein PVH54_02695 [Gammaproteobacteria bacterium]